jgi:hypothetical protein
MRNKYLEEKTWIVSLESFDEIKFKLFFENKIKPFIIFLYSKYTKDLNIIIKYDYKLIKANHFDNLIFGFNTINKCKFYCVESEMTYEI